METPGFKERTSGELAHLEIGEKIDNYSGLQFMCVCLFMLYGRNPKYRTVFELPVYYTNLNLSRDTYEFVRFVPHSHQVNIGMYSHRLLRLDDNTSSASDQHG